MEHRGLGLFHSIELKHDAKVDGDDLALELMKLGLLTKSTHTYAVRFSPALNITEPVLLKCTKIIKKAVKNLEKENRSIKREIREQKQLANKAVSEEKS